MRILLTGGCGFIGSAVVRHLIRATPHTVVDIDRMTYAVSVEILEDAVTNPRHTWSAPVMGERAAPAAMPASGSTLLRGGHRWKQSADPA